MISHHLCSERVSVPTSMVSYYHQVYPLTVLRECLFPLTLPWCCPTTKSTHTLSSLSHTLSHPFHPCEYSHGVVLPPSHHTPTPILVLPLTPIYHVLTHSAPLTSFHLILTTNSSQLISHTLPPIMPPSHHHHFLSPITTNHHQSLPLTPHNTPNPSISLPTLPIVS